MSVLEPFENAFARTPQLEPVAGEGAALPDAAGVSDYDPSRYGFIDKILRKQGRISSPEVIQRVQTRYAEFRRCSWGFVAAPGEFGPESPPAIVSASPGPIGGTRRGGALDVSIAYLDPKGALRHDALKMRRGDGPAGGDLGLADGYARVAAVLREAPARGLGRPWAFQLNGFSRSHAKEVSGAAARTARGLLSEVPFLLEEHQVCAERALGHVLAQADLRRSTGRLARFVRHLDPETVRICRRVQNTHSEFYNWLNADGDQTVRAYRHQAADQYPLLAGEIRRASRNGRGVDRGESVTRVVAREIEGGRGVTFGDEEESGGAVRVPDSVVARMHGLTWQRAGAEALRDPVELAFELGQTPGNWLPKSKRDFAAFRETQGNIKQLARVLERSDAALLAQTEGRWADWADRFRNNPGQGVDDMLSGFRKTVVLPVVCRELRKAGVDLDSLQDSQLRRMTGENSRKFKAAVRGAFLGDAGLKRVMEASARWHRELPRLQEAVADPEVMREVSWAPLTTTYTAANGCTVEPIVTEAGLRLEGYAMSHCVGGYARACLDDCHILSIRGPRGNRLSTVQLREGQGRQGRPNFEVVQHHGPGNSKASKAATAALRGYRSHLRYAEIDWEGIRTGRREGLESLRRQGSVAGDIGFKPEDRTRNAQAFDLYRRYMTGPARKAPDLESFLASSGLGEMISKRVSAEAESLRQNRRKKKFDRIKRGRFTPEIPAEPHGPQVPYAEMSFAAFSRLTPAQVAVARPVLVQPGEGMFAGYEPDPAATPKERAVAIEQCLRTAADGESGRFVQAWREAAKTRPIVAPTVEEARAVRRVLVQEHDRLPIQGAIDGAMPAARAPAASRARYLPIRSDAVDLPKDRRAAVVLGVERLRELLGGTPKRQAEVEHA